MFNRVYLAKRLFFTRKNFTNLKTTFDIKPTTLDKVYYAIAGSFFLVYFYFMNETRKITDHSNKEKAEALHNRLKKTRMFTLPD